MHVRVVGVHEGVKFLEDLVGVVLLQRLGERDVHDVGDDLGDRGEELLGEVLGERDNGPGLDEALLALGEDVGHRDFVLAVWVDAPGVSCLDVLGKLVPRVVRRCGRGDVDLGEDFRVAVHLVHELLEVEGAVR